LFLKLDSIYFNQQIKTFPSFGESIGMKEEQREESDVDIFVKFEKFEPEALQTR